MLRLEPNEARQMIKDDWDRLQAAKKDFVFSVYGTKFRIKKAVLSDNNKRLYVSDNIHLFRDWGIKWLKQ